MTYLPRKRRVSLANRAFQVVVLISLFIITLQSASAAEVTDTLPFVFDTGSACNSPCNIWDGMSFISKINGNGIVRANKTTLITATHGVMLDQDLNIMSVESFVGNQVTFSESLVFDDVYYIMVGTNDTTGYARRYRNANPAVDRTNVNFTVGVSSPDNLSTMNNYTTYGFGILNVTTEEATLNFSVTVNDEWNGNPVNGINVSIGGTTYENATGNIVNTLIPSNASQTYDINISGTLHFSKNLTGINVSTDLAATLFQSQISFQAYNAVRNDSVSANFTINGTTNTTFYPAVGTYNVTANKTGYYGLVQEFNVSALDNKTVPVYGLYTTRLLISPRDIINNNTIDNANITLSNSTHSYSLLIDNVTNATFNITTGRYLLEISVNNRTDYSENITINDTGEVTYYAYMYAYNSLWVYAFDQATGLNITSFNVTVENLNNSYSASTNDGIAEINNILSGTYDVIVSAVGYSSSTYSVTMTDNSHQDLNAYLSTSLDTFIFTVKDKSTNDLIEGVTIVQKRVINGTPTVIETKDSDISGRVQFNYVSGVEYTFEATMSGYETKIFNLEILFSEYTLFMIPEETSDPGVFIDDVSVTLQGYVFKNNATTWIAFSFGSPGGTLEDYFVNITLPNGTVISVSGSSPPGEVLNASSIVNGVTYGQSATVTYSYKSTLNVGYKTFTQIYAFTTWDSVSGSAPSFIADTESMSDFEKVFWATIITIVISGILGLVGTLSGEPMIFSAVGVLISFGLFAAFQWLTWPVFGMVAFITLMLIISRLMNQ